MSPPDLDKLDRAIAASESLLGTGILPDAQIQETLAQLRARRAGLIAATGSGAVAAGAIVGSAVHTGSGDIYLNGSPPGTAAESDLRTAYLRLVRQQCRPLPLGGIDPAAAGPESEPEPPRLDAVYTALLTLTPRQPPRQPEPGRGRGETALSRLPTADDESPDGPDGDPAGRLSALELADREPRLVLLGDPGSGKSTFVNFLALCLAGEALGDPDANLARLTRPLPDPEGKDRDRPQPWSHGAPLPVRVVLRDFAAAGLPADPAEPATAEHLWAHIAAGLGAAGLGDYAPMLRTHLLKAGGLILLDGLDEVSDASRRRLQVKQSVESFAALFGGRCRFLATSRTYAYRGQGWSLAGFAPALLAPWCDGQIRRFVDLWYDQAAALGRLADAAGAPGRAGRLKAAIFARGRQGRLLGLARRPLLLTLIASLHAWRGGNLPERREQLYADAVELLLNLWEGRRYSDAARGREVIQSSIAEWLDLDDGGRERVRAVLEDLAFEAHATQSELTGTADIPGPKLSHRLMRLAGDSGSAAGRCGNPAELERYLRDRAGLLIPRGVDVYSFPHRSFQEYLAACRLTRDTWPDELAGLARSDPDRWREVTLLAAAKAARGSAATPWQLADALCWRGPEDPRRDCADPRGAFVAGLMLAESANLAEVSESNLPKLERIRAWLLALMRAPDWPAAERALAGDTLARLGDPRFDPGCWYLPREARLGFLPVPAGRFVMGEWMELHELDLPAFWMARWPVTVDQFRAYLSATGREPEEPGCLEDPGTRPVRFVSWYAARDYADWLAERLKESAVERVSAGDGDPLWVCLAEGSLRVGLPTEAQWEHAGRGTDGRIYPWGEWPHPDRANYDKTGIGDTSPVGAFPGGATPAGCEEMIGNCWEWTRSLWGKDWGKPEFGYPYRPEDGREDPRASGSVRRVVRGGAFNNGGFRARLPERYGHPPEYRNNVVGFRCAVSPLL